MVQAGRGGRASLSTGSLKSGSGTVGWPFIAALGVVLLLVTYIPALVTWLPTTLMGP
jgi:TRAP-type C4-dicarboxylate transport system permease large subunit